jgi:hypothetical protein
VRPPFSYAEVGADRVNVSMNPISLGMISGVIFYIVEIISLFITIGGQQVTLIAVDI